MEKSKLKKLSFSIFVIILFISFISASDIQLWSGKYLSGNPSTNYDFNFTIYDNITEGESCWNNSINLMTNTDKWWYINHTNVAEYCHNATIHYYLNIEIDGKDQEPRRLLKHLKYADRSLDVLLHNNLDVNGMINAKNININGDLNITGNVIIEKGMELLNIVYVDSINDLPSPVGGTINLEADMRYVGAGLADSNMIFIPYNIKFDERTRIENMYITILGSITSTEGEGITFINSQIVYGGSGDLFYHNNTGGISRIEKSNIVMPPYGGTVFNWTGITDPQTITLLDQVAITSVVANNYNIGTIDGISLILKDITIIYPNDGFHLNNMLGVDISVLRFFGANVGGTFLNFGGTSQSIIQIRSFNPIIQSTEYAIKLNNLTNFDTLTYFGSIPAGYTHRVFAPGSYDYTDPGFKFLGNTWIPDSTAKVKIFTENNVTYITSINNPGVWVELNGNWSGASIERFNVTEDGNMTYIGLEDISVLANARLNVRTGSANQGIGMKFYKNGVALDISEGMQRVGNAETVSIYSQDLIDLNYGDILKVYTVNYDSASDITLYSSNIILTKV